ncbi:hypothetical protein MAPG_04450 [Magnaporthiopsis poae ATCC 64411]|uniref:Uncharacterized protein n=1 Tax=Magnaporthiopsis poae (strain ATCC 64411 / 73-15) TaxID=644358 RepID=A0A0C4DWS0_MAGP6|nr:hypothetical protein MAPG_04450 [Magnaporthiopsis poae ATCC 64411]
MLDRTYLIDAPFPLFSLVALMGFAIQACLAKEPREKGRVGWLADGTHAPTSRRLHQPKTKTSAWQSDEKAVTGSEQPEMDLETGRNRGDSNPR